MTGGGMGGMGGIGGMGGGAGGMMGSGGAGGGSNVAEVIDCQGANAVATIDASIAGGFAPNMVTIAPGEAVKFDNVDMAISDTSTSGTVMGVTKMPDGIWNTGTIPGGGSACVRIDVAGSYPYYCDPHAVTMQGTIIVQ